MKRAPVTAILVAFCLIAYAIERTSGDGMGICRTYGLVPAHATVCSALSAMFLHDPASWLHVGGNVVALVLFGVIVERKIGSLLFLALYLLAGLGGAACHVLVDPSSTVPEVGASGAIFGVMAVAAMLRPRLLGFVGGYVAFNIWQVLTGAAGSTAVGAHLGGFAAGAAFFALVRAFGSRRTYARAS